MGPLHGPLFTVKRAYFPGSMGAACGNEWGMMVYYVYIGLLCFYYWFNYAVDYDD